MRKIIQYVSILLIVAFVFVIPASAAEDVNPKASNYFAATSQYLYKTSDTEFQIWYDASGVNVMDEIGASSIKVQRSEDGSSWTTVKTYTKDSYPEMVSKNTGFHSGHFTYSASKGYYYRAYVIFYAKKGTGTGTLGYYTSNMKL